MDGVHFPFSSASVRALGPTGPPNQRITGTTSMEVKRPGHEVEHSPQSGVKDYSLPRTSSWRLLKLIKNITTLLSPVFRIVFPSRQHSPM
jgi:hypothetical protein